MSPYHFFQRWIFRVIEFRTYFCLSYNFSKVKNKVYLYFGIFVFYTFNRNKKQKLKWTVKVKVKHTIDKFFPKGNSTPKERNDKEIRSEGKTITPENINIDKRCAPLGLKNIWSELTTAFICYREEFRMLKQPTKLGGMQLLLLQQCFDPYCV